MSEIVRVSGLSVTLADWIDGDFVRVTIPTPHSTTTLNVDEVRKLRDALTKTLRKLER